MKSIFEGLLKLKFRSIKKDLAPAAEVTIPLLPRILLLHEICPMQLMPMARADAIIYKMHKLIFRCCQEFRG